MPSRDETVTVPVAVLQSLGWFFENSKDIFLALQHGRLKRMNPVWARLTGFAADACLDEPFLDFVAEADAAAVGRALEHLGQGDVAETELCLRTAPGDMLFARASIVGARDGWRLAIVRDVTAEKLHEQEREEARRVAGLVWAKAGVTIWRYDPDTDHYEINPDLSRAGRRHDPAASSSGDETRRSVHREDAPGLLAAWTRTLQTGEAGQATYRERVDGGGWRNLHVAWQGARQLASGAWEVLGIAQDQTALVKARDAARDGERIALEAIQAKSRFLANVSHELRTPMNGILGILHLLKAEGDAGERLRLIGEALASGVGLADLLNDIIELSDLETGRIELAPESVDADAQLRSVVAMLRPRATEKGIGLEVSAAADLGRVRADPARLRKMFFHLIGNAVKFTASGEVRVRLETIGDGEKRRLRFEAADTGVGIAPDAQAALCERFTQADASLTRRFGGVGLGLAVTARLARIMGGEVGFASREGEGSTFWFEIAAPAAPAAPAEGTAGADWLAGLRVLIVEDHPTNRLVASKILELMGAVTEVAENGAQGVSAVEAVDYDLVFMDIQMPVMDGIEATRRIRAMPAPKSHVPILAVTANVAPDQVRTYRSCGIDGVVAKPISPAALVAEIARVGERAREAAAATAFGA